MLVLKRVYEHAWTVVLGMFVAVGVMLCARSASAQLTGPLREFQNHTAVSDTLTERLMAQRQAIRAGTDAQALEGPVDPMKYVLGPGDGVYLNVFSAHVLDQDLAVTPEGKLILPMTGQIDVAGITVAEAEKRVNDLLKRDYKQPDAHLSLRKLKSIKVSVLGEVLQPGIMTVTAMTRVSEAISRAGDLVQHSSSRNIEVRRSDGTLRTKADLLKFYNTGDLSANPFVESGDVIVVPRVTRLFSISGAVAKAGSFEFREGDKLSTAVALAGGLMPSAQLDSIEIARFSDDDPINAKRFTVSYAVGAEQPLHDGDVITIKGYGQYRTPHVVAIDGEIEYPGRYPIEVGQTRLRDVIERAGGILPTGSLEEAILLRRTGVGSWENDPEYVMLERMHVGEDKRVTDDQYNYFMAKTRQLGRNVMVVNFKDLLTKNDESQNLLMRENDSIYIPRARGFVTVIGSVNIPGNVNYVDGGTYEDYIIRAGGYTSSADKSSVRVINSKTSSYIDPRNSHYEIGPGDTIVIPPERPSFWQNFQIVTAVSAQVLTIIAGIFLLRKG